MNDNSRRGAGAKVNTNVKQVVTDGVAPDKSSRKKDCKWTYAAIMICGVLLIGGGVFAALYFINQNQNNTGDSQGQTQSTSVANNDTDLKAGGVTTTIDGRTVTYNAAYVVDGIDATIDSGTYESVNGDEVVFLVINGGSLKIDGNVKINKTGPEDFSGRGDNYSFYGTNSAIVVVGEGSSAMIDGATIITNVSGANAVVATDGGTIEVAKSNITTLQDNSRGLHATYDGVINADSTTISTQGESCAALATDRGNGTVMVANMKLSTAGAGSPLIYSTGNITVTNSTGTATGAQIAVVEGKNSVNLQGCDFSANGNGNRNGVDNAGVMIYQSMSGDASVGVGSFTATDSKLTILPASAVYAETPFFFVTNTDATIDLTGVEISFSQDQVLVTAGGTSEWGRAGANGGNVTITTSELTATNTMTRADDISSIAGV